MNQQEKNHKCDDGKCEIHNTGSESETKNQALASELVVETWLNTENDISLSDLKGKVVVIEAFQMLCPACVNHSLPQAQKLHDAFRGSNKVQVLGLHTVFEHHEAMQRKSLQAFLYEFRYDFPVAIDKHVDGSDTPETMKKYNLRGTPSTIIIDKNGNLSEVLFGAVSDLVLGLKIGKLLQD